MPPVGLANSVLRQITHASLGGNQIRVQFSNKEGAQALTIKSAHVALCKATPLVNGSIDLTTDKALAFSGMATATIPAGMELWSDPVDFALPALGNLTITTAFGSVPTALTSHNGSRTTSFIQANSTDVSAASLTAGAVTHWYFISGVDVMAPAGAKGIVAIGDSITDGRGVDVDANNRWTDVLAKRLHDNPATANVSIMNQGIGATKLVGAETTTAESRFARDVLGQSGVKYVIIYDGVNDINESNPSTLAAMKAGLRQVDQGGPRQITARLWWNASPHSVATPSCLGPHNAHETVRQKSTRTSRVECSTASSTSTPRSPMARHQCLPACRRRTLEAQKDWPASRDPPATRRWAKPSI